jgi:hypothetical protein
MDNLSPIPLCIQLPSIPTNLSIPFLKVPPTSLPGPTSQLLESAPPPALALPTLDSLPAVASLQDDFLLGFLHPVLALVPELPPTGVLAMVSILADSEVVVVAAPLVVLAPLVDLEEVATTPVEHRIPAVAEEVQVVEEVEVVAGPVLDPLDTLEAHITKLGLPNQTVLPTRLSARTPTTSNGGITPTLI